MLLDLLGSQMGKRPVPDIGTDVGYTSGVQRCVAKRGRCLAQRFGLGKTSSSACTTNPLPRHDRTQGDEARGERDAFREVTSPWFAADS